MIIKEHPNHPGYFCSDDGKVFSAKVKGGQGKINYSELREVAYKIDRYGYMTFIISETKDGKRNVKYPSVHRFVYETFNGEIPEGMTIDHINNDTSKNGIDNLQELTNSENCVKRDHTHGFGNRRVYRVYDDDLHISFPCTADVGSKIYDLPIRYFKGLAFCKDTSNKKLLQDRDIHIRVRM